MEFKARLAGSRVLVTGGAGFIGSHLVRALLELGASVRVLDNFSTGSRRNLAHLSGPIDLVEGSLTDPSGLTRALRQIDYVLHQGAIPSVPRSIEDPATCHAANVEGTLALLIAARAAGIRRLVYASSSSVYGDPATLPVVESLPTAPLSPYAVQKLAAEQYCRVFHRVYGLETVCLRYFNVFGARQDPRSTYAAVVPRIITAALEERVFVVNGDGCQSRDFTHVDNVVNANLLALTAPAAPGQVFNIACGNSVTLNQLIEMIATLSGREVRTEYGPRRPADVLHSLANISGARDVLGYRPRVTVRDGLRKTIDWFTGCGVEGERLPTTAAAAGPAEMDDDADEAEALCAVRGHTLGLPRWS